MLMPHDQGGSYLSQCHLTLDPTREGKHILEDEEDLMNHIQECSERHMYSWGSYSRRCQQLSVFCPTHWETYWTVIRPASGPRSSILTVPHHFSLSNRLILTVSQLHSLAHAFAAGGRSVLLSATTGAAAVNLSKSASTVHNNLMIPVTGFFRPLPMHSVKRLLLKEAKIFIIDEMSMLTQSTLNNVLNRLMQIHNVSSFAEVLQKDMTKYYLSCQPHFDDPGYAEFLNLMSSGQPTQSQVDEALSTLNGVTYVTKEEARQMVGAHCRALCTHREDVTEYNHHVVLDSFSPTMQVPVFLFSSALDVSEMASWVADPKFYRFKHVAIGCKVALQDNIQVSKGAANGSTGTVTALKFSALPAEGQIRPRGPKKFVASNLADLPLDAGDLYAIHVQLDSTTTSERTIRVTRSD
ncbi:hypothetical protein CEUSTIGMA_g4722.t1 [Chlamydomonas eustigma]|uniref:ATP-dependent DNA helicase n=1 Tax=Chlamydomonas eustigma TaxID=1157962 RepID=A0A250X2J9_9CHLO|nr:hypothetical protein CEUSTIGMA_g4722.t1 [Chlamydomonas eustigma]|eukprot:GAX77276.1 hypothetical protein CEUSTIGMA_g4722.t1 [Chlamydomonas eustigma]